MLKAVQIKEKLEKEFPKLLFSTYQLSQIKEFLELLATWNQKFNLTSIQGFDSLLIKHILDSLAFYLVDQASWPSSPLSGKIMDLGSGAGLPGLILSIYDPSLTIYSLDKSSKKISFQQHIKTKLGLDGFHPQTVNINSITKDPGHSQSYNCIIARAFSQIKTLLGQGRIFLQSGGYLILWKGQNWLREWEIIPSEEKKGFELCLTHSYRFGDGRFGGTILIFHYRR